MIQLLRDRISMKYIKLATAVIALAISFFGGLLLGFWWTSRARFEAALADATLTSQSIKILRSGQYDRLLSNLASRLDSAILVMADGPQDPFFLTEEEIGRSLVNIHALRTNIPPSANENVLAGEALVQMIERFHSAPGADSP
jgi:hypothetical protein